MTTCERGDVVLVPFPFTDQSTIKKRPAAVISSNHHNKLSFDVVIMAITSQIQKTGPLALRRSAKTFCNQTSHIKHRDTFDDLAAMDEILRDLLNLPSS